MARAGKKLVRQPRSHPLPNGGELPVTRPPSGDGGYGYNQIPMIPSPPETQASLIVRLRDAADVAAWDEFVAIYGPLVYRLAMRQLGIYLEVRLDGNENVVLVRASVLEAGQSDEIVAKKPRSATALALKCRNGTEIHWARMSRVSQVVEKPSRRSDFVTNFIHYDRPNHQI